VENPLSAKGKGTEFEENFTNSKKKSLFLYDTTLEEGEKKERKKRIISSEKKERGSLFVSTGKRKKDSQVLLEKKESTKCPPGRKKRVPSRSKEKEWCNSP